MTWWSSSTILLVLNNVLQLIYSMFIYNVFPAKIDDHVFLIAVFNAILFYLYITLVADYNYRLYEKVSNERPDRLPARLLAWAYQPFEAFVKLPQTKKIMMLTIILSSLVIPDGTTVTNPGIFRMTMTVYRFSMLEIIFLALSRKPDLTWLEAIIGPVYYFENPLKHFIALMEFFIKKFGGGAGYSSVELSQEHFKFEQMVVNFS